jgi:aromatic-L-amino-acid/L-tryptophan decarboxylase
MTEDPLALDPETMRRIGYRTVDVLVDELTDGAVPVIRRGDPEALARLLDDAAPESPEPFDDALARLVADVLPFRARLSHPGFFGFVPSSGTWPGVLGDLITSALNINAAAWMVSAGPSQLELQVLGWFSDWVGFPAEGGGILVSGGSAANMAALACAREQLIGAMRPDIVAYVADQAHSSVPRAARVLGFGPEQVRVLPVDADYRIIPRLLAAAMDADVRAGRQPFFVSASGGATNTGAVDPLPAIAEICRERGAWMHVDAAYGGFSVLTERGRRAFDGVDLADSLTLDPHKWLYQPYECGCVLVRDGAALPSSFAMTPEYLHDAEAHAGEVNFADYGVQLSRSARALKLWLSIRTFGLGAFRTAIDRALDLAEHAAELIRQSPALELLAPPSLGILCFRRLFREAADEDQLAELNRRLMAALEATGFALVTSTRLRDHYALRMCVLNHTTRVEDVERTLSFLETAAVGDLPPAAEARDYSLHPDARQSWPDLRPAPVEGRHPDLLTLAGLSLFDSLSPAEAGEVAALAVIRDADAGATIIKQWDVARGDFYVVLDGTLRVDVDDARVRELGPGDMFGEIAAIDWTRGYGYPRTASVIATEATRLIVFPEAAVNVLVERFPAVRRRVIATLHERLPTE